MGRELLHTLGILSQSTPRLVTTWQKVPAGTNGGITVLGTAASAAGGLFVGLCFFLAGLAVAGEAGYQWYVVPLGVGAGLVGSMVDSLLGATVQFSGFCSEKQRIVGSPGPSVKQISGLAILGNHAVNFVSALITSGKSKHMPDIRIQLGPTIPF
ncbi:hypothetical protein CYMTET_13927 [Cymbomonas tetramitiformis]|uniref:Transmembrane protein 19 n=1 Tax=Cymbomonas tetramitiformis TaxID=36881 RepID=A0AAE0LAX4_9CHLO|nr:hypothetical protein CYMTET_13927 [Cymbomonas tetramitiformis]